MLEICELCKVLSNPFRLEILHRIYEAKEGFNFGRLAEEMGEANLCASGVSQYLRELVRLNIVRRRREGIYVSYYADLSKAPKSIAEITALIIKHMQKDKKRNFVRAFVALRNPFRVTVLRMLSKASSMSTEVICDKTCHAYKHLDRDLKPAIEAGLIQASSDQIRGYATYRYIPPKDPVVACLMAHLLKTNR